MEASPPNPKNSDDETDAQSSAFAEALEEFEGQAPEAAHAKRAAHGHSPGQKVHGTVVSIAADHALIDIGARSEAVADLAPLRNEDGTLRIAPGQEVDLFVVEVGDQITLAPSLRADPKAGLDRMREARAAGVPVEGRVTGVNTGGLEVELGGLRGFCPVSQVELGFTAEPAAYVGRTLEFLITQVDDNRRSVVLSRRELLRRAAAEEAKQRLSALKVGDELEGAVRKLEAFGAFVDLGGVDGLVHVSEISHERLAHPRDGLREGEKVRVRVIRIEPGKDGRMRIALSIKATGPDPWTEVSRQFAAGQRVKGRIARIAEFGAFVTLAPGVDGLIHVSELAAHRVERVKDVVSVGQEVEAMVQSVDPEKRRISLSIKATNAGDIEDATPREMPAPRREGSGSRREGSGSRREESGERREGSGPRREGSGPRREGSGPRREGSGPRREGSGPRREGSGPRREGSAPPRETPETRTPETPRPPAPEAPRELTTMAIALREAVERAKKKQDQTGEKP